MPGVCRHSDIWQGARTASLFESCGTGAFSCKCVLLRRRSSGFSIPLLSVNVAQFSECCKSSAYGVSGNKDWTFVPCSLFPNFVCCLESRARHIWRVSGIDLRLTPIYRRSHRREVVGEQVKSVLSICVDGAEGSAVIALHAIFLALGTTLAEACVHLFQAWKRRAVSMQLKNYVKGLPGCEVLVISGLNVLHVRRILHPEKFAEPYTGSNDFMEVEVIRVRH